MIKVLYDISMKIENGIQVYKNRDNKRPKIEIAQDFSNSSVYESVVTVNCHTGTHIDSPLHVIPDGANLKSISINNLITSCKVLDLTSVEGGITVKDLESLSIEKGDFLLLKTKSSFSEEFLFDFVFITRDAANWLVSKGIKGVGTDALGIERDQEGHPSHKALLSNGIVILEGLRLKEVPSGKYTLIALPIKLDDCEAAPVRAVLCELV